MTFHRRLCIIGTGLRRFGKRSSLVAILLLFLASCSTAPTDTSTPGPNTTTPTPNTTTPGPNTSTPGPNVTDHATELPTPVTVGDDPECEPDREWIRSGNTLTQRLELGFRSEESGAAVSVPAESLLITGDLSILDVQAVVEYDLYDLKAFGSSVVDREGCPDGLTLRFAAQAALSEVVGRRAMRDLFLERRVEVEQAVHGRLQETLDLYDAGIRVLSVALQQVRAPEEVRSAFDGVLRARQEKLTLINQARSYENTAPAHAYAEAELIIGSAETTRDVRRGRADEDVSRVVSVLKQYDQEEGAALKQLYLQAIEEILPGVAEFIVAAAQSKNSGGDSLGASSQYFSMVAPNSVMGGYSNSGGIPSFSTADAGAHWTLGSTSPRKLSGGRLFLVDAGPVTLLDMDIDFLVVNAYAVARTVEPAEIADMVSVVSVIINSALRDEIAQRSRHEAIGARVILDREGAPVFHEDGAVMLQSTDSRSEIVGQVLSRVNASVDEAGLGIEVVDLRLKNIAFPEQAKGPIFERMRSEREKISRRIRAEGEDLARKIRADVDRQSAFILAEAEEEAKAIIGEGDIAIINGILEALTRDPELLVYEKAIQAYKVARGPNN